MIFKSYLRTNSRTTIPRISINQFRSSFWLERKWYFRYEYEYSSVAFYSIKTHESTHYELKSHAYEETYPYPIQPEVSLVNHLITRGNIAKKNQQIFLFNVTELTIHDYSNSSTDSISAVFDRIIPLTKLLFLSIHHRQFCVTQLIDLLYFSPSLQILFVNSLSFERVGSSTIQETETFRKIVKNNQIRKITVGTHATIETRCLLDKLCP